MAAIPAAALRWLPTANAASAANEARNSTALAPAPESAPIQKARLPLTSSDSESLHTTAAGGS
ncbi:hypothetical protein ACP70R_048038 [Stipagrostis hirtigluma subsp. patula]